MKLLKKLYKIYSPSGKEWRLRQFIQQRLAELGVEMVIDKAGNLYATKGKADTYPCIVAHMDQVQKVHSKDFECIETEDIIFGYSRKNKRQEGLGADDKNGIWIALKCLEKYPVLKCVFFVEEETGCNGSKAANLDFFDDCRYVLQCDRKGSDDLITKIWETLCSEGFVDAVRPEKFGYAPTEGLLTDVATLKEGGLQVSAVNMSCGYYEPHTDHEIAVKKDLLKCLGFVQHIIEDCTDVYYHVSEYGGYGGYGNNFRGYIDQYDELLEWLSYEKPLDLSEMTGEDLYKWYHEEFPLLHRSDFQDAVDTFKHMAS